ncbi:DNL-type zinc finger protein [Morus notabilis]|uniref:DNL-type zinc finger protein n=1 Tax=Morus notabilis TaxID=981085 RepID=W9R2L6_9ROSA|nr:uncharacterized protein LOC21408505 [Morus notabilis]EXB65557.1 DNL-type zinc finger protein [Morus notabilis]
MDRTISMAVTTTVCGLSPALNSHSLSSSTADLHRPTNSLLSFNSFKPFSSSKPQPTINLSRLILSHRKTKRGPKILVISGNSETCPESEPNDSNSEATVDIKLPRRSLLVQFTCDLCGERTQRLVNRLAYERGLIYVQCAGCLQHHKLVDNLGLVVEYDLREEINADRNEDDV